MTNTPNSQPTKRRSTCLSCLLVFIGIAVVLLVAIQLIPINHTNPAVTNQLNWDSQQTKDLAYRACMDCHSNETTWPWYSRIAPVSWLVYFDVQQGREELNFSTLNVSSSGTQGDGRTTRLGSRLTDAIQEGSMPPIQYIILHPSARLSTTERQQLADGLLKTLGLSSQ